VTPDEQRVEELTAKLLGERHIVQEVTGYGFCILNTLTRQVLPGPYTSYEAARAAAQRRNDLVTGGYIK
jgi:hypothetical protein